MRGAILVMVVAALTQSTRALADGSPSWARRAMRSVARVEVPERDDIINPGKRISLQAGSGFFVGSGDQVVYLVTASHVIWPERLPMRENKNENVKLSIEMQLPDCHAVVPALADSAQASPQEELDMAIVTIKVTDMPNDVGNRCREVITHLPRHIIDPHADRLEANTRAWLIGPGTTSEAIAARTITFEKYANDGLHFKEPAFTEGDSGSPVFSESGHILGMAVKENGGVATRFSRILTKLDKDWVIPTNLAGPFSMLRFRDRYGDAHLSIAGAQDVALELQHPAPLGGKVELKLRINDTQEVTGTVNVREGTDMDCDIAISRWLARHKRAELYTTFGLVAAAGLAFAVARTSQNSFERSPSRSSYDRVRLFNAFTIGTGSAALASLGVTAVGYLSSDTSRITCRERPR